MKRFWHGCRLATLQGGRYSIIEDGALLTEGELIRWVGPLDQAPDTTGAERIDLGGAWVTRG